MNPLSRESGEVKMFLKMNHAFSYLGYYTLIMLLGYTVPGYMIERIQDSHKLFAISLSGFSLHFFSFALFTWLFCYGYQKNGNLSLPFFKIAMITWGFGLFIEIIQIPIPYRDFGLMDLGYNLLGIISVLGIVYFWRKNKKNQT